MATATATTRFFRIQYLSQFHITESTTFEQILPPVAPYLALTGNIAATTTRQFERFADYVSRNWAEIFCVAGDNGAKEEQLLEAAAASHTNLHFLHSSSPARYLAAANVAILGGYNCALAHNIHYYTGQRTPICVLTHEIPGVDLFTPYVRAWIHGMGGGSGVYKQGIYCSYAYTPVAPRRRDTVFVEFACEDGDATAAVVPLQELCASAAPVAENDPLK
jgi:hypothetical protein